MQAALKNLAVDDTSLSGYLYHRLLGHDVEPQVLKTNATASAAKSAGVPGLPDLNPSQAAAVRAVVQQPLEGLRCSGVWTFVRVDELAHVPVSSHDLVRITIVW